VKWEFSPGVIPTRVRGADVVFISHERSQRRNNPRGSLDVPPELLVEIFSPENAHVDMRQKVDEYLTMGVNLVLVVDPDNQTISAHRPGAVDRLVKGQIMTCGDMWPGFVMPVAAAFE
jgi:Uma2 family endonuclease